MAQLNKRNLREFVRLDQQNRIVPGSNIARKSKPKVGKWLEIPQGLCCDPLTICSTTSTSSTTTTTTTIA